jgi:rod shape-determining protein MreC
MNNLTEFFKKNFHYFLLAVLLVVCCVSIRKSMAYSQYKLDMACQSIIGPVQQRWAETLHRFGLGKENEELARQNIALLREHENMFMEKSDTVLTMRSKTDSLHPVSVRLYDYTFAHVIYNSVDQAANCIILDKGAKDGIEKEMAVTSPEGVVGVVQEVSNNFAYVLPVLNRNSRINAIVSPLNQVGTIVWEGADPETALLENIPQHLEINIGDSVLTSGYSRIFPRGLFIGSVKEVSSGKNASFLTIKVKLGADFSRLNTVYLIRNLYKSEIDSLKAKQDSVNAKLLN